MTPRLQILHSPASKKLVITHGSQSVLPPTPHPSIGLLYHWTTRATLLDTSIAALPVIAADIEDRLTTALAPWIDKSPLRAPPRVPLQRCELSEHERERHRRYAETILVRELGTLAAMASNSGRNHAAFRIVCRVGRWVHGAIIPCHQLTADVLRACEANGLVHDDGRKSVLATVVSGLAKSAGDTLPDLGVHHG